MKQQQLQRRQWGCSLEMLITYRPFANHRKRAHHRCSASLSSGAPVMLAGGRRAGAAERCPVRDASAPVFSARIARSVSLVARSVAMAARGLRQSNDHRRPRKERGCLTRRATAWRRPLLRHSPPRPPRHLRVSLSRSTCPSSSSTSVQCELLIRGFVLRIFCTTTRS